jgi:hypothetical protein
MPVVDNTSTSSPHSGVYAAVRAAVDEDIERRHQPHPALEHAREMMRERQTVDVPAYLLPKWVRPVLKAGHSMLMATVTSDDRVTVRAQRVDEILPWLGL